MSNCILLQLAKICSMTFQATVTSMKQKIIQALIKIVPVEPLNRNRLNQIAAFSYYGISYIIIFYIISISKIVRISFQIPDIAILLLALLRAVFNLGYLFTRNTLFITFQKLCFMVHCFFGYNTAAQSYMPFIILDIVCYFFWSLSLQQRNHHFDSRLGLNYSFIKNIIIELFCFVWVTFQIPMEYQPFYFSIFSYSIYILDSKTNYYKKRFKTLLTSLDLCCLISSILPIIYLATGLNEFNKLEETITIINILAVFFLSFRSYEDYAILYRIDPWACRVSSAQILDYAFALQNLIKSRNRSEIIKYCVHHIRKCPETDCSIKYHEKDGQNKQLKGQQVLMFFRNQQLSTLSKKYQILKEYIIFNFQNDLEKFSSFRSSTNFFHQREYLRFYEKIQERTKQIKSQFTSQFLFQLDLIPIIKKYTEEGLKFWIQLLQLKANATKIMELGSSHLEIMQQIDTILKKGIPLNPRSQLVTHSYLTYLLGCQNIHNTEKNVILKAQDNLTGFREAHPTVLVSAQKHNFLRITNANLGAVKATYYTKEQMLTVKVDALWDKQIRQQHITLARRRARYNKVSSGQLVRSYAFLKNKFGYVVMADGIVYYFDDLKGKKWCVILEPYLENQPVIVINAANRQLIGISELSLAYGLRLKDEGKRIDEVLFNQCSNSKKEVYIKNNLLFENQEQRLPSRLNCSYYLKFHTLIYFHGKPRYYIFSLSTKNGRRDQQPQSQDSIQNKVVRKQSKERVSHGTFVQESIYNFQFHYSFSTNIYSNQQKQKKTFTSIQTARLLSKQDDINSSLSSSVKISDEEIKIKYDEDIIEMRLWNNKLDFLQNLQAPIPNFDSLPELKSQTDTLLQPKWKEQLIKRFDCTPTQIKMVRGFYLLMVVIASVLVAYANISSYQNRISKVSSFHAQHLIFKQYEQLSSLSSVVLKQFYDQSANIGQQISEKVKQIDSVYIQMQQDPILNNYIISFKKDGDGLTKWDDLYRLVIKSYLLGNSTPTQVVSDFLDNLGIAWDSVAQMNLAYVQNKHMAINSQNIIILTVSVFILIALWIIYRKLKFKLQELALEMCQIFLGIDHRVICAQVKKYHSFKQFIDLDKNLIRQQSIEQLREQENAENIYQKKASNKQNFTSQTFIFTLALMILKAYFIFFFLQQYKTQKTFQSLFQYMHYSDSVSLEVGKLWLSLNLDKRNKSVIENSEVKIQNYYRISELISLNQLSKDQTCKKFRSFIVGLSYSSIDKYLPNELLSQLGDNSYKSQKDLVYMFLRKKEKTLIKNQSRLEFQASKESTQLYKLHQFYFSKINKILNEKINSQVDSLNSAHPSRNNQLIIIIAAFLLMMSLSYWLICRKIMRMIELQKIMLYIPFKFVSSNKKYIRYRNKVKIIQR